MCSACGERGESGYVVGWDGDVIVGAEIGDVCFGFGEDGLDGVLDGLAVQDGDLDVCGIGESDAALVCVKGVHDDAERVDALGPDEVLLVGEAEDVGADGVLDDLYIGGGEEGAPQGLHGGEGGVLAGSGRDAHGHAVLHGEERGDVGGVFGVHRLPGLLVCFRGRVFLTGKGNARGQTNEVDEAARGAAKKAEESQTGEAQAGGVAEAARVGRRHKGRAGSPNGQKGENDRRTTRAGYGYTHVERR